MNANTESIRADVLAIFARFVRLNPWIPADDPMLPRVFDVYASTMPTAQIDEPTPLDPNETR